MRPSVEDSMPRLESEPPGWHVRETTDDGYPLMGSSPAEQAEAVERLARIRKQSEITSHRFEGDGSYCQAMLSHGSAGNPATTGVITMTVQCGYPADLHVLAAARCVASKHIPWPGATCNICGATGMREAL